MPRGFRWLFHAWRVRPVSLGRSQFHSGDAKRVPRILQGINIWGSCFLFSSIDSVANDAKRAYKSPYNQSVQSTYKSCSSQLSSCLIISWTCLEHSAFISEHPRVFPVHPLQREQCLLRLGLLHLLLDLDMHWLHLGRWFLSAVQLLPAGNMQRGAGKKDCIDGLSCLGCSE